MKTLVTIFLLTISLNLNSQNTVCFTIEPNTTNGLAFSEFTKYVNVLNCFNVYAEQSISDEKVLHAAAVAAELLDNNEDGVVDDQTLKLELTSNGALIPIFSQEGNTTFLTFTMEMEQQQFYTTMKWILLKQVTGEVMQLLKR